MLASNPRIFATLAKDVETDEDVRQVFEQFGSITEIKILPDDKRSKDGRRIAYVTFETDSSAGAAVSHFQSAPPPGTQCRLAFPPDKNKPPPQGPLYPIAPMTQQRGHLATCPGCTAPGCTGNYYQAPHTHHSHYVPMHHHTHHAHPAPSHCAACAATPGPYNHVGHVHHLHKSISSLDSASIPYTIPATRNLAEIEQSIAPATSNRTSNRTTNRRPQKMPDMNPILNPSRPETKDKPLKTPSEPSTPEELSTNPPPPQHAKQPTTQDNLSAAQDMICNLTLDDEIPRGDEHSIGGLDDTSETFDTLSSYTDETLTPVPGQQSRKSAGGIHPPVPHQPGTGPHPHGQLHGHAHFPAHEHHTHVAHSHYPHHLHTSHAPHAQSHVHLDGGHTCPGCLAEQQYHLHLSGTGHHHHHGVGHVHTQQFYPCGCPVSAADTLYSASAPMQHVHHHHAHGPSGHSHGHSAPGMGPSTTLYPSTGIGATPPSSSAGLTPSNSSVADSEDLGPIQYPEIPTSFYYGAKGADGKAKFPELRQIAKRRETNFPPDSRCHISLNNEVPEHILYEAFGSPLITKHGFLENVFSRPAVKTGSTAGQPPRKTGFYGYAKYSTAEAAKMAITVLHESTLVGWTDATGIHQTAKVWVKIASPQITEPPPTATNDVPPTTPPQTVGKEQKVMQVNQGFAMNPIMSTTFTDSYAVSVQETGRPSYDTIDLTQE
eukprot:TRINITY_DN36537_c0_g1_i1.p1 TRINITY_DN36537_c0_g1~~TRINITY_DN36537_c0_g1_i1.p1  ORF type:complete len:715 (+),score=17.24 TRINITY_DN36537_c0_g1_i1:81-2225(+)